MGGGGGNNGDGTLTLTGGSIESRQARQASRIEVAVAPTPEALTNRVRAALERLQLTGVEGHAFGLLFNLHLYKERDGFLLQSPPRKKHPWDSDKDFVPDIYAAVNNPSEVSPDGLIVWGDQINKFSGYDEIASGQKISMVLDQLLAGIERTAETQTTLLVDPQNAAWEAH